MKRKSKKLSVASFLNIHDVVNYVRKLHSHIKKQNKKIIKLKLKIHKMTFLSKLDAHIAETKEKDKTEEIPDKAKSEIVAKADDEQENVLDFVNEIKAQAMKNSFSQAGFIYEPTSGLYYDTKSGYYYSPDHDLYYNGNDANWYRLNPRTNEFIFHSGTGQAVKKVQLEKSVDSLLNDFKSLRIAKLRAHGFEIDEDEAIRKILEDGRKPTKGQETSSKQVEKESKSRRRHSTSSESSDASRHRRRRHRSRSRSSRHRRSRSRSKSRNGHRRRRNRSRSSKREEGEIDSSENSASEVEEKYEVQETFKRRRKKKKGTNHEEIAKKYPPSLRIVVVESDKLDIGKLFVVTFKGGTLGREGNHDVLIPDVNVSKSHLKFFYNQKRGNYQFTDRSRNGTLLDGKQTSLLSQEESKANDLDHGSILQLAKTKLLCHVHEGLTTCSDCEPYNYTKKPQGDSETPAVEAQPSNLSHKEQLKLLQKRYGLATEKYQENPSGASNKNYEDRAEKRRVKVGSSHGSVKTETASVNTSISSENKGFKLLSKMGWSEGKSIGKSQEGIKEPIQVKTQQGTSGLGNDDMPLPIDSRSNSKKKAIWSKTQERYNNLKKNDENIFDEDD